MQTQPDDASRAGWTLRQWCAATSIGVSTFYVLPSEVRPKSAKIGKRLIIIEPPAEWLSRMANASREGQ